MEHAGTSRPYRGRRALRQERARPILQSAQGIETWLREQQPVLLPKSPIGNAVNYALANWTAPGSNRGGRAAAVHFTLIQSAKRHGLDPFAYLRSLLIAFTPSPPEDLAPFLPDNYKASLTP